MKRTIAGPGWRLLGLIALVLTLFNSHSGSAQTKVTILHVLVGPKQGALWVAQEQGIFAKHGVDVQVLYFDPKRASRGMDLKVVTAINNASPITQHLVTKPEIKTAADLRGKRYGINRIGTGSYITAMQALAYLGLDPNRDGITLVESKTGPLGVVRALESGEIDAAGVDPLQSAQLRAKGFFLLFDTSATDLPGVQDGIAVAGPYLRERPDVVEKVVAGMVEELLLACRYRTRQSS
jgi:NitT/TauT family transport system substrate-binding protein